MFIKLTRKDNGQAAVINTDKIVAISADPDGGTMIMLDGEVVREVTEDIGAISSKMQVVVP